MPWGLLDSLWSDPWRERLYPWTGGGITYSRPIPAVNVYGNDERVRVMSEVPGLNLGEVEIKVQGRNLTLAGKRELPPLDKDDCFTCQERASGEFLRSITLPYEVEADKVEAHYERGVLTIDLPRAEKDKPRKITVKAA
jgi:HSP20 family protein